MKYLVILILSIATIVYVGTVVYYREKFTAVYNHEELGRIYSESPYVKGPAATTGISDDGLFAVAGYYLLFDLGDPSRIHFESPPLGEYLIGVSIALFKNERVINILYGMLFLWLTYYLAYNLFHERITGALAILFITLDPLFHAHLIASQLDLPQALFTLFGLTFFIRGLRSNTSNFFICSLFLGCAAATKFFPGIIFFVGVFSIWCYLSAKKKLKWFLISLLFIPLSYLASYSVYFVQYKKNFSEFLALQKYIIAWRLGNPRVVGNIIPNLLTGRYRTWWEPYSWKVNSQWTVLKPIIFVGSIVSIYFLRDKKDVGRMSLYVLMCIFLIYIGIATTGVTKYIFPIYPLLAIYAAYSIVEVVKRIRTQQRFAILTK